jgi:hypothetical protein
MKEYAVCLYRMEDIEISFAYGDSQFWFIHWTSDSYSVYRICTTTPVYIILTELVCRFKEQNAIPVYIILMYSPNQHVMQIGGPTKWRHCNVLQNPGCSSCCSASSCSASSTRTMARDDSGRWGDNDRPCVHAFSSRRKTAGEGCRVEAGGTATGWEEKLARRCRPPRGGRMGAGGERRPAARSELGGVACGRRLQARPPGRDEILARRRRSPRGGPMDAGGEQRPPARGELGGVACGRRLQAWPSRRDEILAQRRRPPWGGTMRGANCLAAWPPAEPWREAISREAGGGASSTKAGGDSQARWRPAALGELDRGRRIAGGRRPASARARSGVDYFDFENGRTKM